MCKSLGGPCGRSIRLITGMCQGISGMLDAAIQGLSNAAASFGGAPSKRLLGPCSLGSHGHTSKYGLQAERDPAGSRRTGTNRLEAQQDRESNHLELGGGAACPPGGDRLRCARLRLVTEEGCCPGTRYVTSHNLVYLASWLPGSCYESLRQRLHMMGAVPAGSSIVCSSALLFPLSPLVPWLLLHHFGSSKGGGAW